MFPKTQRINSVLFTKLFKEGKKIHGDTMFIVFKKDVSYGPARFSVVVPKKVEKGAVQRNRIKRQMKAYLKTIDLPTSGLYIVVYKKKEVLVQDVKELFEKI